MFWSRSLSLGHILAIHVAYLPTGKAQNLAIPSNWNTTSAFDRESREIIANGAAAALFVNGVDPSYQKNPTLSSSPPELPTLRFFSSVFSVLALQDYHSGNVTWSNKVVDGMQEYYRQYNVYSVYPAINSDSIYWGLAFFYAYRTYKQQVLLDLAISAYNATYTDAFITPSVAASGIGAGRGMAFSFSNCSNLTYAGGVFLTNDALNDTQINAETVAPFLALSAYLYEETNQTQYQQAAQLAVDFTINHMWAGTIFQDTLYPATCTTKTDITLTLGQWFVEGLAIWANVTKNDTLTSLLQVIVPNVTTYPTWALDDGIIKEAFARDDIEAIDKGIFIRALTEVRARNPGTALAQYIESYITVQYNSILNHALAPNTDLYTTSWFGPSNLTFSAAGNIAALDVLNAAFSFLTPTVPSPSPKGSGTPSGDKGAANDGKSKSLDASTIAGSVVGSVIGLAAIVGALILWRRRRIRTRNNRQTATEFIGSPDIRVIQPFDLNSPIAPSSKWERLYAPRRPEAPSPAVSASALAPSPVATTGASGHDAAAAVEENFLLNMKDELDAGDTNWDTIPEGAG